MSPVVYLSTSSPFHAHKLVFLLQSYHRIRFEVHVLTWHMSQVSCGNRKEKFQLPSRRDILQAFCSTEALPRVRKVAFVPSSPCRKYLVGYRLQQSKQETSYVHTIILL